MGIGDLGDIVINEKYYDFDFTKAHIYLKNIINKIYTSGVRYIYPDKDVAFALELALKCKIRFFYN